MKPRVFDEIAVNRCGNSRNIANVLHHGSNGDRCHCKDCSNVKFAEEEFRNTYDRRTCYSCKAEDSTSICVCHTQGIHDQGNHIRNNNTHQNRNNTEHSNAPDVEENNSSKCDQSKDPVLGCVADCRRCKAKTNTDNNRTSYNRRQITHDALYANYLNDHCKYQIQKSCYKHTTACIWKLLSIRHVGKNSGVKLCNGGKSAKKCK